MLDNWSEQKKYKLTCKKNLSYDLTMDTFIFACLRFVSISIYTSYKIISKFNLFSHLARTVKHKILTQLKVESYDFTLVFIENRL